MGQDADAVGAALSDLLADTAERDRMTEAGRRLVERGRGALAQTLILVQPALPPPPAG